MITFRKILAASSGELVTRYFTEDRPDRDPNLDLRCEPGRHTDPGDRLTSYYLGRDTRAHWRQDMAPAVARALGIDPRRAPRNHELVLQPGLGVMAVL